MQIFIAGENALIIYFSDPNSSKVSAEVSAKVQHAVSLIRRDLHALIIDLVPSYASLLVIYDLHKTDHHHIRNQLRQTLTGLNRAQSHEGRIVTLPVYYSLESGPDLEALAARAQLSVEQVIEIHQQQEYRVYAIGFAPGFAYLGEVDSRIAAPRLATPRLRPPSTLRYHRGAGI